MNNQAYQQLLQDLTDLAEIQVPPCNFEDVPEVFDFSDDFSEIFEGRE